MTASRNRLQELPGPCFLENDIQTSPIHFCFRNKFCSIKKFFFVLLGSSEKYQTKFQIIHKNKKKNCFNKCLEDKHIGYKKSWKIILCLGELRPPKHTDSWVFRSPHPHWGLRTQAADGFGLNPPNQLVIGYRFLNQVCKNLPSSRDLKLKFC